MSSFAEAAPESRESLLKENPDQNSYPLAPIPGSSTKPDSRSTQHGQTLRRFWLRGLVPVLVLPIFTAYYFLVWFLYLDSSPADSPISIGPSGGRWVFYSWFVIGVIGLELSSYGLEGIEASMMMTRGWAVNNAMLFMMHGDHSWSGPDGWLKAARNLINFRSKNTPRLWPSILWVLLSFLSSFVFVALPFTGLAMNLGSGYVLADGHPEVFGFRYDTFNSHSPAKGASINWEFAFESQIPGLGVIYTPPETDRSDPRLSFLENLPSSLPIDDGVSEIFLAPQANAPVNGNSWGLALKYNCSIETDLSQYSILRYRNASKTVAPGFANFAYQNTNNDTINIYNQTDLYSTSLWAANIFAVLEVGYQAFPNPPVSDFDNPFSTQCYFNARPNLTGDYPGLERELVFEAILWQYLQEQSGYVNPVPVYTQHLESSISALEGAYKVERNQSMRAVGVTCKSSSAVGTADISGVHQTFSNFQRTDTPIPRLVNGCAQRFDAAAISNLLYTAIHPIVGNQDWFSRFFSSVSAPSPLYAEFAGAEDDGVDLATGTLIQTYLFQATDLRNSILRAYASYASQLAYNGGQGFSSLDGTVSLNFTNPNLTAYEPSIVLQRGVISPALPAVLLVIWALGTFVLGCWYGFRRRWAPKVDGFSLFVFGVDLAERVKSGGEIGSMIDSEECDVLRELPGLVGDAKPADATGRIGLVGRWEGSLANRKRLYT